MAWWLAVWMIIRFSFWKCVMLGAMLGVCLESTLTDLDGGRVRVLHFKSVDPDLGGEDLQLFTSYSQYSKACCIDKPCQR